MKSKIAVLIAFVMLFNSSGEIFAQVYTLKGLQQGPFYVNTLQQKEQSDKLSQEIEKTKQQQEVAALFGVKYEDFKRGITDYAEDNNIKIDEMQIKQLYNKHLKELTKYDSDYKNLVNIFSKKTYKEVIADANHYYFKQTEEINYNNKKYGRVALLHAAIHNLIIRDTIGNKEKVEIMGQIYDIVAKEGYYPQDRRRLWSFAYNIVKEGKQYFDVSFFTQLEILPAWLKSDEYNKNREKKIETKQIQANAVASAIALLPVLSTSNEKAITAEAIYNLAKDVMRYDYGPIGITTGAQALITLKTDHSLTKLQTLLTEDLYRGLATRVSLYALDSISSFEAWENRGANRGNKAAGGLGQYHNAIARRFIYIDPNKNTKELMAMTGNKDKALEVLYKAVATDILEDIGKMIGKASGNAKVAKMADNLALRYVNDISSKLKGREAKMHTSVVVGILATTKKRSQNLTKAAKIIYNGHWWDISEATQRDKNNIAAKYLGYGKKPYNAGKYQEFKTLCYVKKLGHFVDIAIGAIAMIALVASAPKIVQGIRTFANRGMNLVKKQLKTLGETTAQATKTNPAIQKAVDSEIKIAEMHSQANASTHNTVIARYINAGDLEFKLRNYEKAFIEYEKVLKIDPKNPEALNKLAQARQYAQGRVNFYEKVLRENPYDIDMNFEYADLKIRLGDLEGALRSYEDILEIRPNNPKAFMDRAYVKYQLGDYFGAISDVEKSLSINHAQRKPEFYEYAQLKASDLTYYNFKIKNNPTDASSYFGRAKANLYLKNFEAAMEDLNMTIKLDPKNAECFLERAKLNYQTGDFAAAYKDVNNAITYGNNNAEAFFFRGKLNAGYAGYGNLQKAIDDFTEAINLDKKIEYFYERGHTYYRMKNYSKALSDYDMALADRQYPKILLERAEVKYLLEDYKGCVEDIDAALRIEPKWEPPKFYTEAKEKLPLIKVEKVVNDNLNISTWNWD